MEDYEIVNNEASDIGSMLPVCKVETAGVLVADFAEKKQALQTYMDKRYKDLAVTEETISSIKKDLAELRKVESKIGEIIKQAQADFNKPIELTIAQAKEFKQIVTNTIADLATKQKAVDEGIKAKKQEEAIKLYKLMEGTYPAEVQAFAQECQTWIVKEQWKNKTYTDQQIKADSRQALDNIKFALQVFQGKYKAQALDQFKRTGNLTEAQNFVAQMEEADRKQAQFEAERIQRSAAQEATRAESPVSNAEVQTFPISSQVATAGYAEVLDDKPVYGDVVEVSTPESYCKAESDYVVKTLNISIKGPVGVLNWVKDIITLAPDTTYKVITTDMVLNAAQKIMQSKKTEERA